MPEKKEKIKVGEHIKDSFDNEWCVSKSFRHSKWTDYELININTGERGDIRVYNQ